MSGLFFIVLPSNSGSFPDNKISHYKTRLANPIRFEGTWVMAVYSVIFTHSFEAFGLGEGIFHFVMNNGDIIPITGHIRDFNDVIELEKALNTNIKNGIEEFYVERSKRFKRVRRENVDPENPPLKKPKKDPLKFKINRKNKNLPEGHEEFETESDFFDRLDEPIDPPNPIIIDENHPDFEYYKTKFNQISHEIGPEFRNYENLHVIGHFPSREDKIKDQNKIVVFEVLPGAIEFNLTQNSDQEKPEDKKPEDKKPEDKKPEDKESQTVVEEKNKVRVVSASDAFDVIKDEDVKEFLQNAKIMRDYEGNFLVFPDKEFNFSIKILYDEEKKVRVARSDAPTKIYRLKFEELPLDPNTNPEILKNIKNADIFRYSTGHVIAKPKKDDPLFWPLIIRYREDENKFAEILESNSNEYWDIVESVPEEERNNPVIVEKDGAETEESFEYAVDPSDGTKTEAHVKNKEIYEVLGKVKQHKEMPAYFEGTPTYEYVYDPTKPATWEEVEIKGKEIYVDLGKFENQKIDDKIIWEHKNPETQMFYVDHMTPEEREQFEKENFIPTYEFVVDPESKKEMILKSKHVYINLGVPKNIGIPVKEKLVHEELQTKTGVKPVVPKKPVVVVPEKPVEERGTKRSSPGPDENEPKKPKYGDYPLSDKDIERAKHEIRFTFQDEKGRFLLKAPNDLVKYVLLPDKLSFMLGFEHGLKVRPYMLAKYTPDVRAGIRRFCIYENSGLTELMMFGDKMTSLLRVISVRKQPGQDDEQIFDYPMYKRVIAREIEDIEIEVKTMDNKYVPFNYGEFVLTLVFKRVY